MGAQGSSIPSLQWGGATVKTVDKVEFMNDLAKACQYDKVDAYKELWLSAWPFRAQRLKAGDTEFDTDLLNDKVMRYIRHGLQHPHSTDWREAGVMAARTFLYNPEAREDLKRYDLPACLSMMTMDDGEDLAVATGPLALQQRQKQVSRNLLAVDIMAELTEHPEFIPLICKTSILNYLCIVLNQVPEAAESVSAVFVKLSDKPANLNQLREASVSDILESTVKTIPFERQPGEDFARWQTNIKALANVSRVLGTMLKYQHECQVEVDHIIKIFDRISAPSDEDSPDCLHLLSQLARLLYWVCRTQGVSQQIFGGPSVAEDVKHTMAVLVRLWNKSVGIHLMLAKADLKEQEAWIGGHPITLEKFCTEDLDRSAHIETGSPGFHTKVSDARSMLCYLNCLLWLWVALPDARWKLRQAGFRRLQIAFDMQDAPLIQVVLITARHLVDSPGAQQCGDLMRLFGDELMKWLEEAIKGPVEGKFPHQQVLLLLDTLAVLSLQRGMQELFTEKRVFERLQEFHKTIKQNWWKRQENAIPDKHDDSLKDKLREAFKKEEQKINVQCLLISAQVSVHPSNRLSWVCSDSLRRARADAEADPANAGKFAKESGMEFQYSARHPARQKFEEDLERRAQDPSETVRTVASLLLTLFQERKFHQPAEDLHDTFGSVFDWWRANSTAQHEELKDNYDNNRPLEDIVPRALKDHLEQAMQRRETGKALTSVDSMSLCAPQECVLALSLFSRLALESKFKSLFKPDVKESLLACVCSGISAEAREAAATIANLMWMPDAREENLACWLKLDGPHCIATDAANVLMPVKAGNPKPVEMGRGMYKSTWGVNFVKDSWVTLHPQGLQTYQVPGTLTSASAMDTFKATASPYQWLGSKPDRRRFSITCWFYWPAEPTMETKVLIQTTPLPNEPSMPSVAIECAVKCRCGQPVYAADVLHGQPSDEGCRACGTPWSQIKDNEKEYFWVLCDDRDSGKRHQVRTPTLLPGWHHLGIISSQSVGQTKSFGGTKFVIDDWVVPLKRIWIKNDFYNVGNWATRSPDGKEVGNMPFGLIADFRIYADALQEKQVKGMAAQQGVEKHPEEIVKWFAARDAATILAQRLDCADTAAECLRALGSLATLTSQRAKIFSVCGREVLNMLDSPYPMLQRQAARLLGNLA